MADEIVQQQQEAPSSPAPQTSPSAGPPQQASASPSPSEGAGYATGGGQAPAAAGFSSQGGQAGQPAPTAASVQASWRQQLHSHGVDTGQADDGQVLSALAQAYRDSQKYRTIEPYANSYMQHAQQFHQWLQSQQGGQQASQPQPAMPQSQADSPWFSKWWQPPEYNRSWESMVRRDEAGNLVAAPGAPPDVVPKYLAYAQFRREQADKFMENPYAFMEEPVKHLAQQMAQQEVQKHMSQYQDVQSANAFVQEHNNWLYERDPNTGGAKMVPVYNPATGQQESQRALSQWGQLFRNYVVDEAGRQNRRGYSDIEEQKQNALQRVQLLYMQSLLQRQGQQGGGQQQQNQQQQANGNPEQNQSQLAAANQRFLQQNNPPGKRTQGNSSPAPTRITQGNLAQVLRDRLKSAGVTDEEVFKR